MLLIAGTFAIDPDRRDEFANATLPLMRLTRAEDGCVLYTFTPDLEDPGRMHVIEKWESQEDLDRHLATEHVAEFVTTVRPLIRESSALKYQIASEGPVR